MRLVASAGEGDPVWLIIDFRALCPHMAAIEAR